MGWNMFGLCRSRFYQPVGRGAPLARLAVLASFVAATAATPALAQNTPPPEKSGSLPQTAKETGVNVTRLVGATVNAQHQFIGVVDDLIVSQDRIDKAVVGLSGSLGIGEKDISVPFTELSLQTPVSAAQGTAASPGQSSGSLSLLPDAYYQLGVYAGSRGRCSYRLRFSLCLYLAIRE
jgi:hypothetical protein